jgi:hypothetical protein
MIVVYNLASVQVVETASGRMSIQDYIKTGYALQGQYFGRYQDFSIVNGALIYSCLFTHAYVQCYALCYRGDGFVCA